MLDDFALRSIHIQKIPAPTVLAVMDLAIADRIEQEGMALTVERLAMLLDLSQKTIRRAIARKKLPAYHIGTAVRLDPSTVANWLRNRHR